MVNYFKANDSILIVQYRVPVFTCQCPPMYHNAVNDL